MGWTHALVGPAATVRHGRGGRAPGVGTMIVKMATVIGRPGSDLLSQVLRLSTIGAGEFNGRVRDGIGFGLPAMTTRPAKDSRRIRNQGSEIRNQGANP